jgi:hypothetical protein
MPRGARSTASVFTTMFSPALLIGTTGIVEGDRPHAAGYECQHLQIAPGHLLHEAFGHLHRTDQIGLENTLPHRVVGFAERRVRAANTGVVQENVDRVVFERMRQGFDRRRTSKNWTSSRQPAQMNMDPVAGDIR